MPESSGHHRTRSHTRVPRREGGGPLELRGELRRNFGLVGPDGAGKTTTLRMFAGSAAGAGAAAVAGFDVALDPERVKQHSAICRKGSGCTKIDGGREHPLLRRPIRGKRAAERRARERLLQDGRHESFRKRFAGKLSGGMKQKLGWAAP